MNGRERLGTMDKDYILEINNLSKSFPGVKALDNISFNVERGTVHAIVGENGAGKSTLIKILAGIYRNDSGTILMNGNIIDFTTPYMAQVSGVSVVHQELKLSETLTVTENIYLGRLIYNKFGLVDWSTMRRNAKKMITEIGMDLDTEALVETLSIAKKQIVEICKATTYHCSLLIMDEPSATLTEKEQKVMFGIIRKLKQEGMTVIYISHRLEEIFDLADNVTVLRDGKHIDTCPVIQVDRDKLITMMVGREISTEYPKESMEIGDTVLEVKGLNRKGVLRDIHFMARKGEVLGIAGLVGAGRTELARAVLGIDKIDSGEIFVYGKSVKLDSFKKSIQYGFGLVPEDRKKQGLIQIMSVKENICLVSMDQIIKKGVIRNAIETRLAKDYCKMLRVVMPSIETEVQYLSGGNQQKVVIAKWLMQHSEIIFLDEPTRGIDVGAKTEIYKLISELVKQGKTVILISSELPEVIGMCDRILVMHEGAIKGELMRKEFSQEKILSLCV